MAIMNPYNYSKPKTVITNKETVHPVIPAQKRFQQKANSQTSQYLESKILSAKPEELTYMLYDGLVKFIKKAMMGLDDHKFDVVSNNALKAQAIIDELRSTLNMEIEMSQGMDSLYEYLSHTILEANLEKSKERFEEALEIALDFRETWKDAFDIKD